MCGIFFACSRAEHTQPDDATRSALSARGPDSLSFYRTQIKPSQPGDNSSLIPPHVVYLTFTSSVLSLRGESICVQPLVDPDTGSVFCWNGEAWKFDGVLVQSNDTKQVFELLLNASSDAVEPNTAPGNHQHDIVKVLTRVTGPYAFVYFDATTSTVYYGRDRLGRRSLVLNKSSESSADVEISSLSFEKQQAIEVGTDGIYYLDLKEVAPSPRVVPWPSNDREINKDLPSPEFLEGMKPSFGAVTALSQHLSESVRIRILNVPTYTAHIQNSDQVPSKVAILFSGGLDCTLLARIAHDNLPLDQPIDLLNVAFENPRTVRAAAQSGNSASHNNYPKSPYEACPDRMTARASFAELTMTCSSRTWRFVSIDVPFSETLAHRSTVIKLMSPHNTEMDLSIALALYFASRGQGRVITSPDSQPTSYTTTARVLLSGLGADELFGGYTRHAAAFNRIGYAGLNDELELDFTRIGSRNLGRDDRVMAHWGREIRYPYLDEDFVTFALGLPAWEKVGFRPGRSIPKHSESTGERVLVDKEEDLDPAKMLLRLAAWSLGMKGVATEKKRAIQFGARTAKMEGGRTKGTDLLSTGS